MLQARTIASVGVGVIVVKNGKVLLMKRSGSHGEGTWSCPGGHIDFGESLEECAIRETKEETGLDIKNIEFKAITNDFFPLNHNHYVTVWMKGEYTGGEPTLASPREGTEIGWFEWYNLPEPLFVPLKNLVEGKCYPQEISI